MTGRSRAGFVAALGAAQIVSWCCLYYSFSRFVLPMHDELGWSLTALNGALTTGLLVAGLCALPAGILIDRIGGRTVMTAGSVIAAVLVGYRLLVLPDPAEFLSRQIGVYLAAAGAIGSG
mgnify:CR=1 FL=1